MIDKFANQRIMAGVVPPVSTGLWVYVDIGFSQSAKSCGLLIEGGEACELTFASLKAQLVTLVQERDSSPLHLVIEAPMSVAFNKAGNPTGRKVELRDGKMRYWYVGLGSCVMVAAMYLLKELQDSAPQRAIYLYEGLVSFKNRATKSNHADDVRALQVAKRRGVFETDLKRESTDTLVSAFAVAGLDWGIPPVLVVE